MGLIDKYIEDDCEGTPFRYLSLSDFNLSYVQKVEPFFGDLNKELIN